MATDNSQGIERGLTDIALAIQGKASSRESYSTNEVDTGTTWIDGKSIYKKTTTSSFSASGSEQGLSNITGASTTQIIKIVGGVWPTSYAGEFWPFEYVNPGATTIQNIQAKTLITAGVGALRFNCGANGIVAVTAYYVK